ncbi:MAG: hypothetical protein PVH65_07000 [Chloroflexota bacterium]|jgi:hypothetical protein
MRYRAHDFDLSMTKSQSKLELFLNKLEGEVIAIIPNVIFAPAGGTGAGAVLTATQSGAWGIGVDFDYYDTVFEGGAISGADRLLSSAVKQFDMGV